MPTSEADCVCRSCASGVTVRPYAGGVIWECTSPSCDHWNGTVVADGARPEWVMHLTEVVTT